MKLIVRGSMSCLKAAWATIVRMRWYARSALRPSLSVYRGLGVNNLVALIGRYAKTLGPGFA